MLTLFYLVKNTFSRWLVTAATMSTDTPHLHQPKIHIKARSRKYPLSDEERAPVSDDQVPWEAEVFNYTPTFYTAPAVSSQPVWADPDYSTEKNLSPKYNHMDGKVNRMSFTGVYQVEGNVPLNPIGRTGLIGRGLLGKWGPNHAADPIVTRWKRGISDKIVKHPATGKPILQFVAIQRRDTKEWAIPGGMVDAGENVSITLKREFGEETLNTMEASPETKKKLADHIHQLFQGGTEIYKGYVDDPRNTDNAWMETVAVNFHDDTGESVGQLPLHAGDDAGDVCWMDIDESLVLYASHTDFIRRVAVNHDAHWRATEPNSDNDQR